MKKIYLLILFCVGTLTVCYLSTAKALYNARIYAI